MLPLLLEVGVHTYSEGDQTGYNETVAVYDPPRDEPGDPHRVYGWSLKSKEPEGDKGNLVVTTVELLAPPGFPVGERDLIDLPDGQYEVMGKPETFQAGPFSNGLGVLVHLEHVGSAPPLPGS